MDMYKRQQFEFLLQTAVERFTERLEQRHRGCDAALRSLSSDQCQGEVAEFVRAIFGDFLLDNIDGACFVLQALPHKRIDPTLIPNALPPSTQPTIESMLIQMATQQFEKLLCAKTREALEQHSGYQPVAVGAEPQ